MGRKRASKINNRANVVNLDHGSGQSLLQHTIVEPQPSSGNLQLAGALDSQLEIPLPGLSLLKHPNFLVDGVETCHEKNPALEQLSPEHEHQEKSPIFFTRKKSKFHGASVRRSERIKSAAVSPPNNCGIEFIEDITVSRSEKDEADTQIEQVLAEPELELELPLEPEPEPGLAEILGEKKCLDEKVDSALQRIEALDKIIELLKSKLDEKIGFCEAPSVASISYKSMYIDSQKKIEALTNENQLLNGKLENALGKIEVIRVLFDVLDKTKDAVNAAMISNLSKTIEAAVNVSTQAIHKACSASAVKRKRNES
ncbi:hypothetical protein CR513_16422, partial [Mucuna pruriens]